MRAISLNIASDIADDITFEVNGDIIMFPPPPIKHWMRHTAMVPKGFIRYHVLEALNQRPMSGSEIINEIENQTGGFWKPSPGSIYPLLAWLQDNGYVRELPVENGLKRYELTERGKSLYEEQKKIRQKVREEGGFLPMPFIDTLLFKIPPERTVEVREAVRRLVMAFFKLSCTLQEKFSEEVLSDIIKAIDETSKKLEEINKKVSGD